jgi:hypothetical protein
MSITTPHAADVDQMINRRRGRTDAHRPSVMNPADYVFVGAADDHATEGYVEFAWDVYARLTGQPELAGRDWRDADGVRWAETHSRRACSHCGNTRIRYWSFYLHVPSGEVVTVGRACAERLSLSSREELAQRAAFEARKVAERREEWIAEDDRNRRAVEELLRAEDEAGGSGGAGNSFVDSLLRDLRKHGALTEKQRDAVLRGIERRAEREVERAERAAEMGDPAPAPAVEGRIVVEGRLLSTKTQEGYYGSELKMLVLDDRGFKVWSTAPGVIIDEAFELARKAGKSDGGVAGALREGMKIRVRFTVTVTRSKDDETFAFGKRPSKAQVIA